MKKQLLISLLLILNFSVMAQDTKKYEQDWKQVAKYQEESLPQSASKVVDKILAQSIADKNTPQIIKALIFVNSYKLDIDNQDVAGLVFDLGKLADEQKDGADKALLYSMIAEQYYNYYEDNSWQINNLTPLYGVVPEDMKEWTKNIFFDKVTENLNLSTKDADLLAKTDIKKYEDIVLKGQYNEELKHNLYDFLMIRAIGIATRIRNQERRGDDVTTSTGLSLDQLSAPAKEYATLKIKEEHSSSNLVLKYQQLYAKYLLVTDKTMNLIVNDVSRIMTLSSFSNKFNSEAQIKAYEKLLSVYENNSASIEIASVLGNLKFKTAKTNEEKEEAYRFFKDMIAKYPAYTGTFVLENQLKQIENPLISINLGGIYSSKDPIKADVTFKNMQSIARSPVFSLFRVVGTGDEHIRDFHPNLDSKSTYLVDTMKMEIGTLPYGMYKLVFIENMDTFNSIESKLQQAKDKRNVSKFIVSDLASFNRTASNGDFEVFVVNRITGKSIQGATVDIAEIGYDNNGTKKETNKKKLKTNALGLVTYQQAIVKVGSNYYQQELKYKMFLGEDTAQKEINAYSYFNDNYRNVVSEDGNITILTDRGIYRPGQTVFFKSIVLDKNNKPIANTKLAVVFNDANSEQIAEKELSTNEFGSVSGDFVIPTSKLPGAFSIKVEDATVYFQVEEYKRPTFEITFDKVEDTYSFGDEVQVRGRVKTYSGVSLQNAEVNYNITRRDRFFYYRRSSNAGSGTFDNGAIKTDDKGEFIIRFIPTPADDSNQHYFHWVDSKIYSFDIDATVTDVNGETQRGNQSLTVGNVSMILAVDVSDQLEKTDTTKIKITATNLQDKNIETKGTYTIYSLDSKDVILETTKTGTFQTGAQVQLRKDLQSLKSGKYQLELKAKDDKGREVGVKKDVIIFSYTDKTPPVETNNWLVTKSAIFGKNKSAEVIFGTTENESHVLYEVYNNEKVFERKFIKLSKKNKTFTIANKPEYGEKVYMTFTLVINGQYIKRDVLINKEAKEEDAELTLKLDVFRDKLRTGQSESWTVSVYDKKNAAVMAELLASMYDKSLDQLTHSPSWFLAKAYNYTHLSPIYYNYVSSGNSYPNYLNIGRGQKTKDDKYIVLDRINWFNYLFNSGLAMLLPPHFSVEGILLDEMTTVGYGGARRYKNVLMAASPMEMERLDSRSEDANALAESNQRAGVAISEVSEEEGGIQKDESQGLAPQIRQNFNETAFFYPLLKTNEKGETLISFTTPESNTSWRFRILAHDKNGRVGQTERTVVTRKELMVTPNMPRFLRQGDKASISTRISNMSDGALSGEVTIEFFDPVTDKPIDLKIENVTQSFTMEHEASSSASWSFVVPQDVDLIGCRVVARSASFSDGEQHALAVLPNRMLVTQSMPFDVEEAGENTFTFEAMATNKSNTLNNYRLSLEYASNPAWYAVMALPTMSNPDSENAVNWFASYYVNKLGSSIVQQYPKVSAMIKSWKQQGADKQTLVSKLAKNDELKSVLLEETPWVLEAKNESEQMERLSLLFDLNNTEALTSKASEKLMQLQTPRGGWMWFFGLKENREVTNYILYGLAKLQLTGQIEYSSDIKQMQIGALNYMDAMLVEDFTNLKKYNKNWEKSTSISTHQLEYMFVRSSYRDIPITKEAREAERFYTSVVSKNWTKLGLYDKSILSILVRNNGDKGLADKLVKSIREHSKVDSKLGMHWPNLRSNVFLSMSAISAHTFMMEAMKEGGASDKEMDLMKKWLVKQKQTQLWETTHASIDAISALLSNGSNWFDGETIRPAIKVGNKQVDTKYSEQGTGYIKASWGGEEIDKNMSRVSINTASSNLSYGALYWQYYENLDKVKSQDGDLNIDKQLFKKVVGEKGQALVPITETEPLTIGNQVVVRLTIRANNDMEFVHLKDMRASCFEPQQTLSGTAWNNGIIYYQTSKDASTNFYIDHLPKGTYVLEYPVFVNRSGEYANGITSIQCLYAPEFVSNTAGIKVVVKE